MICCRWLVNQGRDDEALVILSKARNQPAESDVVQIEYLSVLFCVFLLLSGSKVSFVVKLKHNICSRRRLQLWNIPSIKMTPSPPHSSSAYTTISACWRLAVCITLITWLSWRLMVPSIIASYYGSYIDDVLSAVDGSKWLTNSSSR